MQFLTWIALTLAGVTSATALWLYVSRQRLDRTARTLRDRIEALKVAYGQSIDAHSAVEQRIRGYMQLLDTLINTIPNPIFYKDERGCYLGCNRAFARDVLGLTRDRIIGFTDRDLSTHNTPVAESAKADGAKGSNDPGGVCRFESRVRCADGRLRDFLFIVAPVADFAGRIGVMIDLTEKNKAARERMQKEKFKGVLETAGAVCHELNQPLQVLSGYAEMALAGQTADGAIGPERARKILRQTERMAEITRKLQQITCYETMAYGNHSRIIDIEKAAVPAPRRGGRSIPHPSGGPESLS